MTQLNTVQFGTLRLEHFVGVGEQPKDNWRVFTEGNVMLGYLHNCDGISGYVGDDKFMEEGDDFDKLCELAKKDLEGRNASQIN
jgi:hypothetical protein